MNASNKEVLQKKRLSTEGWLLGVILTTATLLRLYGLDYSFSNDELSALSRLSFDSLSALIHEGIRIDGHPAFVQILLFYWTEIFPVHEITVRLPFVFFGIGSVAMAYLVSRAWFGKHTALLVAASMAGLQFFIIYSQLARPYSPGLFFTWFTAYFWTSTLQNKGNKFHAIAGGIAMALAMYTHYFSFLQVLIMGIVGLFMLNRENRKNYLIAAITALILWAPHLGITLYQFSLGGVGNWLGPPESDFLWQFLLFLFNDSIGMLSVFVLIALVGVTFNLPGIVLNRWQVICLVLFIAPFSIGFYYSLYVNPVLQYSTLIFAAPSIIMLLFSFYGKSTPQRLTTGIVFLILAGTTYGTVIINRHYSTEGFGVFKELASKIKEWDKSFGTDNVLKTANVNSPQYLEHYLDRMEHPVELELYNVHSDSTRAILCDLMVQHNGDFLAFAWSTHYVPPETYEWIRKEFPYLQEAENHFNSGVYLFSRLGEDERIPLYAFDAMDDPHNSAISGLDPTKLLRDSTGWYTVLTDRDEYTWNYSLAPHTLELTGGELLVATAEVAVSPGAEVTLVYEYHPENGEKQWYGNDLSFACNDEDSEFHEIILARQLPDEINTEDKLTVYFWKRSNEQMLIRNLNISIHESSVPQRSFTEN